MTEDTTKEVLEYLDKRNKAYSLIVKEPIDCTITFGDTLKTLTFKHKDKCMAISLEKIFKLLKEMEEA